MSATEISIALVKNCRQQFLISLRGENVHQANKWEFPGGKVEKGETFEQAMCRELKEEVGISALNYLLLESKFFDNGDKQLNLHFYLVDKFEGDATGKEGQLIKWVSKKELALYSFPEANLSIIEKL